MQEKYYSLGKENTLEKSSKIPQTVQNSTMKQSKISFNTIRSPRKENEIETLHKSI
jgi:hypothetical protein